MTLMATDILKKIRSKGYWQVVIHPTVFDKERIPTLARCQEIMELSTVRLSLAHYPYVEDEYIQKGQDWIESSLDYNGSIEYWRFYQSGQFIHYRACEEDWFSGQEIKHESSKLRKHGQAFLWIESTIYLVTEIYEFAARLSVKEKWGPGTTISIKLLNTKGRRLVYSRPRPIPRDEPKSDIDCIEFEKTFSAIDLLSRPKELALDAVEYIFERFNLTSVPRNIWAMEQAHLLERRLYS